jgi:hypothetical protein
MTPATVEATRSGGAPLGALLLAVADTCPSSINIWFAEEPRFPRAGVIVQRVLAARSTAARPPAGVAGGRIGVQGERIVGERNQANQGTAIPVRVAACGSTKVAVLAPSSGTVTGCVIVAPAAPVTASTKVTAAPVVHPPVLMLTS